jgi:membrane-associated phospholipid phosphatase/tRNA A-37 threonylcarbamoyl transferase component Bud32
LGAETSEARRERGFGEITWRRRRRRPSGEAPPLPRQLRNSGKFWLWWLGFTVAIFAMVSLWTGAAFGITHVDTAILQWFERIRVPWLTHLSRGLDALGSAWVNLTLRWITIAILVVYKRWRQLAVFVGAMLLVGWMETVLPLLIARPRPFDVTIIGNWTGFSLPAATVVALSATLVGMAYALIPEGRWRSDWLWTSDVVIAVYCFSRMYLGADNPTDDFFGVIFGMGLTVLAFRLFAPEESFPVGYHRGVTAHLDVSGPRGDAIRQALAEQLGLEVLQVEPFGLAGSGGSSPLRLTVAREDGSTECLFGKLYARVHLRADRNYKFARTILYGRLEDEKPFNSVRQLVQFEDYMLRYMRDAGVPVVRTYGFAEITPEREYVIVTDFLEGAKEISEVEVDDATMDTALAIVRRLWDGGIAHRDIKPANLLVRGEEALIIDVAFAELRPTPWRQAVDLANMMLVLGLYGSPQRAYERALQLFTEDDLAEAFAAARGVASPSQLKSELKRSDKDVLAEYRALVPHRPPVSIQRWSMRRVGVTAWTLFLIVIGILLAVGQLQGAGLL